MPPTQTCSRCDDDIERPINQNANYVLAGDFVEPEPAEVFYAQKHTQFTRQRAKALSQKLDKDLSQIESEIANPNQPNTVEVHEGTKTVTNENGNPVETAAFSEENYSIPDEFDVVEVEGPHAINDPDVVRVYSQIEKRDKQKTGLVCPDCTKSSDEIMWGPDA